MMKKTLWHSVLSIWFFVLAWPVLAQEQLVPLHGNMHLMTQHIKKAGASTKKIQSVASDTLPFFEDFSYSYKSPYPSVRHWLDSNVYINSAFPIAAPSIGVATFDGLNKNGYPYNFTAPVTSSAGADTLTSRPLNLDSAYMHKYNVGDSLYFSFYYQAKGRGDAPELADSLVLEFYKPNQKTWNSMWSHKGYNPSANDTNFYIVMVPIKDTAYLDSSFQFRFRNKATLSGSLDHWHVDYIFINKGRNIADTVFDDVAFGNMSTGLLKNYGAMPYKQFVPSEMATNVRNWVRSNKATGANNVAYQNWFYDSNNTQLFTNPVASYTISPFVTNGWLTNATIAYPALGYTLPLPTDTTYYTIKHVISTTPDFDLHNDTIVYTQRLSNYYAYDDGSAEQAYYLNTYGATFAQRFTLNAADTLQAMDIYFDPVVNNAQIESSYGEFIIYVWNDSGNGPGNAVIVRDSSFIPIYLQYSYYNSAPRFALSTPKGLSPGTYYFGIQQVTNTGLNIGFDKNNNHMDALYYNVGFGWTQSGIPGSLMMHPIFGKHSFATGIDEKKPVALPHNLTVYPNPAQDQVYIASVHEHLAYTQVQVLSSLGTTVLSCNYADSHTPIDISSLGNGVYFIYLLSDEGRSTPEKLIISR